jgi:hypothetical protein
LGRFASRRGRDAADDEIVRMLAEDRAPHSFMVVFTGTLADLVAHGTTLTATTARLRARDERFSSLDIHIDCAAG